MKAGGASTLIRGARVFDGQRLREASSVLPAGGIIADLTATLLPGLIDCHVHASDVRALGQALVFGVTELDMDYLKVYLEDQAWSGSPGMSAATVGALVAAAHARAMLSMAHADSAATARIFLQAGGDALAHVLGDLEVTPEFLADLRGPAFVIATLRAAAVLVRGTGRPAGGRPA